MNNLPYAKKLDFSTVLTLSTFKGYDNDTDRLPDEVLIEQLENKAKRYLNVERKQGVYRCFEYEVESVEGKILNHLNSQLKVPPYSEKLFEGAYIDNVEKLVASYVFGRVVGYDDYFNCPCIIIRDAKSKIVDIVKYRPKRDGYEKLPKYLQEKSQNKPKDRGEYFLYPFQVETERLIRKYGYAFAGEGLKNAVNALIRSVPFVSIESASNANSKKIAGYIQDLYRRGIKVFGAMDGDSAGEKAFHTMNELLKRPIVNLIDFDSGMDFTDFLRKEQL